MSEDFKLRRELLLDESMSYVAWNKGLESIKTLNSLISFSILQFSLGKL